MKPISNLRALAAEQPGWAMILFYAACGLVGWLAPDAVALLRSLLA